MFFFIFPGFSDLNIAGSATAATQSVGGPAPQDTSERPSKEASHPPASVRQRKRRRGGKASWGHGGAWGCGSQGRLDKALASFLSWQRSAEERLLSLEEARLERELQAEERREQREERRAEQERQHELRLFTMLTGALVAVRQGAPTTVTTPADPPFSPLSHLSAPSVSSSLSQPPSEAPTAQAVSTKKTMTSTAPTSVKACKMPQNVLATQRVAETPGPSAYLSNRGNSIRQHQGILQEGYARYGTDRHHDTDNPDVSLCHVVNTRYSCQTALMC